MLPETDRLTLREMDEADLPALAEILQDVEAMRAYEGPFSDAEVLEWLDRQRTRYAEDGFGLWAVVLKETGEMIGECGLSRQSVDGEEVVEVGYLFNRSHWHQGYAVEAARACRDYAFTDLGVDRVYSKIRDMNIASMNVAIRNGMTVRSRFVTHYRGVDMTHYAFAIDRKDWLAQSRH